MTVKKLVSPGPEGNASLPAYFPEPYPDEILFSIVSRYHRDVGNNCAKRTTNQLWGQIIHQRTYEMPRSIRRLAHRLKHVSPLAAERIIDSHTHFSYYTAYLDFESRETVRDVMCCDVGVSTMLSGFRDIGFTQLKGLRFCPDCWRTMIARFGEAYWRSSHQLPGTVVCAEHRRVLSMSEATMQPTLKTRLVCADETACPENSPLSCKEQDPGRIEALAQVSAMSAELLLGTAPPPKAMKLSDAERQKLEKRKEVYRKVEGQSDWSYQRWLSMEIERRYPSINTHISRLKSDFNLEPGTHHMSSYKKGFVHPLHHVLIRCFLKDINYNSIDAL